MTFDISKYLDRIGLDTVPATAAGLDLLVRAQNAAIAFENIDAFTGTMPPTDPDLIFEKLVVQRRGGWCMEANGLLDTALKAIGFDVSRIMARVRIDGSNQSARTHLANLVSLPDAILLADCGFGGPGPNRPLRVEPDRQQDDGMATFRFVEDKNAGETVLERKKEGDWIALYGFDQTRVTDRDIIAANLFCTLWEGSIFPNNLMLNRHFPDKRFSLLNNRFSSADNKGQVDEIEIASRAELETVLAERFDLHPGAVTLDRIAVKLALTPPAEGPDR